MDDVAVADNTDIENVRATPIYIDPLSHVGGVCDAGLRFDFRHRPRSHVNGGELFAVRVRLIAPRDVVDIVANELGLDRDVDFHDEPWGVTIPASRQLEVLRRAVMRMRGVTGVRDALATIAFRTSQRERRRFTHKQSWDRRQRLSKSR